MTTVAKVLTQGTHHRHWVALTFDAGSDAGYARRILTTLNDSGIHATFGVTGQWAEANPQLVRGMAHDGEQIVNHSYDHESFTGYSTDSKPLTRSARAIEITRTSSIVRRLTGKPIKSFFRPPYGDYDAPLLKQLPDLGYGYALLWSVDSLGWEGISTKAIVQRCSKLVHDSSIVLMHVGSASRDALALPAIIALLRSRGYRFVTVEQMVTNRLSSHGPRRQF